MRRLSLRLRLAIASAGGVLVVTSLAGLVQFKLLSGSLLDRVDDQLHRIVNVVGMLRPFGDYVPIGRLLTQISEGQPVIPQIVDRDGRVLDSVGGRGLPIPDEVRELADSTGRDVLYNTEFGGLRFRVLAHHFGEGQILLVARPIEDVVAYQRKLVSFLVAQTLLTTAIAGALGYFVTRQAIRPLQRTADTATEIATTGDLAKRIDAPTADRDLARLTRTVNAMLDRVEDAYARQGEALEAERRFVADASHELRTPLTTIRGNIDYLRRRGADPEALDDMRQAADRLEKLVANLTTLAREDAGTYATQEPLDFDELILDVLREPEYAGMGVETDVAPDLWVRGSEVSLASVVRNLIGNAHKYGAGHIAVTATCEDDTVLVDIRDDGPGLTEEDVEHVFDRFWRSADTKGQPGSGLGLSIVHAAVRSHGGTVEAFPGPGGHFRVTLPAAEAPPPLTAGSDAEGAAPQPGAAEDPPVPSEQGAGRSVERGTSATAR